MRRTARVAAVLGIVGALVSGLAPAAPARAADAPGPPAVRLRAMSYNIHAGAGQDNVFDLERQAAVIEGLRPDVVALQEVDVNWGTRSDYVDEASWLARRLRMRVFFGPIYTLPPDRADAPPREFGLAILSRFPILAAENHKITRLSTQVPDPVPGLAPGFPEIVIRLRGMRLRVYDTHLDFRSDPAVRRAQVADMLAIMNREPGAKILAGDFNAAPGSAELAPLWSEVNDALLLAGGGDVPTYPADVPAQRIDYVTATSGIGVHAAGVPETVASDHRPVVADLLVPRRH
ncbi:MAG TPA: endonuclease/exonuclease/phosphatase family protein [Streptosporangiaceae bacterium]